MNDQAGSGFGLALERAADGLQPFAHTTQAITLGSVGAAAVVGDLQGAQFLVATEPDTTTLRLRMTNHVRHRLAKRQSQYRFPRRAERNFGGVAIHGDSSGFQGPARLDQFSRKTRTPVAADGFTHVSQRGARGTLHVLHLLLGALWIAIH